MSKGKATEDNTIAIIFWCQPHTNLKKCYAVTSALDMMLMENYLNVMGIEYIVQPSILKENSINYGLSNWR